MSNLVIEIFINSGIAIKDATSSIGSKDYLERILEIIQGTGFVVALFSEHTRPNAFANIALELGFAAMCGKPIMVVKSKEAQAPSDLTRTDWIEYSPRNAAGFEEKINLAIKQIYDLSVHQGDILELALEAERTDCAIALERARKAFLLTGLKDYIDHAKTILNLLETSIKPDNVNDLFRQIDETKLFIRQAERSLTHV
ncbi:MAG: hypothetical protein OXD44_00060 [Gammaproteobacteria bacterium]|nr:hypothetical protein [Gammaproteobacteria bacterium]